MPRIFGQGQPVLLIPGMQTAFACSQVMSTSDLRFLAVFGMVDRVRITLGSHSYSYGPDFDTRMQIVKTAIYGCGTLYEKKLQLSMVFTVSSMSLRLVIFF